MNRRENEHGTIYDMRGDIGLELRVVDRIDGERFIEGQDDSDKHRYFMVRFAPEEIRFLASAFVEISSKLFAPK